MRSRRLDDAESTRRALIDSAVTLFTERGYAATSLDEVARRAEVTKGALYHHFGGKQALFEAAFDAVERTAMARLTEIAAAPGDRWQRVAAGVRHYLTVCLDPAYQRIVVHEGPAVMGAQRWAAAEDHFGFGLVRAGVQALVDAGEIEDLPVEVAARLLFGALSAAAALIAGADDPQATAAEVGDTITRLLHRLRRPGAGSDPATAVGAPAAGD